MISDKKDLEAAIMSIGIKIFIYLLCNILIIGCSINKISIPTIISQSSKTLTAIPNTDTPIVKATFTKTIEKTVIRPTNFLLKPTLTVIPTSTISILKNIITSLSWNSDNLKTGNDFDYLISPSWEFLVIEKLWPDQVLMQIISLSNSQDNIEIPFNKSFGESQDFYSWAPNSRVIVTTAYPERNKVSAFVYTRLILYQLRNDNNSIVTNLCDLPYEANYSFDRITWSPDGSHLALTANNHLYILNNQGQIEQAIPIQFPPPKKIGDSFMAGDAIWTPGGLFYEVFEFNKNARRERIILRRVDSDYPGIYQTVVSNDLILRLVGANSQYILIAQLNNNFELDLVLINQTTFQQERNYKFKPNISELSITRTLPEAPYITFYIGNSSHIKEVWIFDWIKLEPQKIEFTEPLVDVVGWRPIFNSFVLFTYYDSHYKLWGIKP